MRVTTRLWCVSTVPEMISRTDRQARQGPAGGGSRTKKAEVGLPLANVALLSEAGVRKRLEWSYVKNATLAQGLRAARHEPPEILKAQKRYPASFRDHSRCP